MKVKLTLTVLAIGVALATAFLGSAAASSHSPTTKVLVTTRCSDGCTELVGVYKARPRHIYLSDNFGGTLTLHRKHWNMRSASGYGSSYAALAGGHITARVQVSLGEWANAEFLYMGIHFTQVRNHDSTTGSVRPMPSHFEALGEMIDEEGQPAWLPLHQTG